MPVSTILQVAINITPKTRMACVVDCQVILTPPAMKTLVVEVADNDVIDHRHCIVGRCNALWFGADRMI